MRKLFISRRHRVRPGVSRRRDGGRDRTHVRRGNGAGGTLSVSLHLRRAVIQEAHEQNHRSVAPALEDYVDGHWLDHPLVRRELRFKGEIAKANEDFEIKTRRITDPKSALERYFPERKPEARL